MTRGYAKTPEALAAALAEIYAQLPDVDCKGLCHLSCTAIPLEAVEQRVIAERTGRTLPVLSLQRCEALTADKRCSIHEHRPLVCRLFGVAEGMPCPHGCQPATGPISDDHAYALVRQMRELLPDEEGSLDVIAQAFQVLAGEPTGPFRIPAGDLAKLAGMVEQEVPEVRITGVAGPVDKGGRKAGPWRGPRRNYRKRPR